MTQGDDEFLKRLLSTFKIEAAEHLNALSTGLVALEQSHPAEREAALLEAIFREAHSLKGASRAVNLVEIETICQSMEDVFSALRNNRVPLSPELFDLLHNALNALGELLMPSESDRASAGKSAVAKIARDLSEAATGSLPAQESSPRAAPEAWTPRRDGPLTPDTVRVSTARLDSLLLQAEDLLSAKLAVGQRASDLKSIKASVSAWEREWAGRRLDRRPAEQAPENNGNTNGFGKQEPGMENVLELLGSTRSFVRSLKHTLELQAKSAEQDHRSIGGMVDNLLSDMKKACMLPFSSLLKLFPKLIRDLSRDQGREVIWITEGEEIEVDRRILEEMKAPLIHLVRNCIDHGIEKPEERKRKGKAVKGTVTLAVTQHDGNRIAILVSDDGGGIDIAKVRAAAVKIGFLSTEDAAALDGPQVLPFVFHSGVSTSPLITDISGRGLGLAIVQEKVERLGGTVSVEARPDQGTAFRIVLPLTLATFRGVLVRVDEQLYVFPATDVERVLRVKKDAIRTVESQETIEWNGRTVSLVLLRRVLELSDRMSRGSSQDKTPCVVLRSGGQQIAFLVDEICGEQEVLVKSLGTQLSRVRNVAGATALGAGRVALVLNVHDLMQSAARATAVPAVAVVAAGKDRIAHKSVLVAEDSITARTLLKNILESAGYSVKTAVDGMDAFTTLRAGKFDLVVSDVDMPRMSGFDLTARIRADKKLFELPVVLVTALDSRQDKERGIDVGADAYIVKSSFDQSNLLEVVQRLI